MTPPKPAEQVVTNTAAGNAQIGIQGVVYGDIRYEVSDESSPDKKFSVARSCLNGNMPRRAEQLIKEAVEAGLRSDEVAYYWAISVLSDRSFDLLEPEQFKDLERARGLLGRNAAGEWHKALDVVTELVDCLGVQEQTGSFDAGRFDGLLQANARLRKDRREEIRRHLDLILTGGIQDRFDAESADEVREQRTLNRSTRVWKFFEPVPEPPREKMPEEPVLNPFPRAMGIGGAVVAFAGLVLLLSLLIVKDVRTALVLAFMMASTGFIVGRLAPRRFPVRYSLYDLDPPEEIPEGFEDYVRLNIERQFDDHAPGADGNRLGWVSATFHVKKALGNDLIDRYSDPAVAPGAIGWLIKWHARSAAREWEAGRLKAEDPRFLRLVFLLAALGLGISYLATLVDVIEVQSRVAAVAFLWLLLGGGLVAASRVDSYLVRRRAFPAEHVAAERRRKDEKEEYKAWSDVLADRPADDEMARWLDYDKIYLKTLAMNQYGLGSREVVAHAVLTEGEPGCRVARVMHGRARYSAYRVWLFLLTEAGVRQMLVKLDFETGVARDQERTTFRYDAIASARVAEFGIRFDDGHREIILPQEDEGRKGGKVDREKLASKLIFRQMFRLSLVNGQDIDITMENLREGVFERIEDDPDSMATSVADTSDVTGAMGILEAVAADGREWITKARARRRRRLNLNGQGPRDGWPGDALTRSP